MTDTAIHTSSFDVRGVFTLTVPNISAYVEPVSVIAPIKISVPISAYADDVQHTKTYVGVTVSPQISAYADNIRYDIGRGDCRFDIACYAPSMMIKVIPGIPDTKSVEFGEFKFAHAKRKDHDSVTVESDDRFSRFGVNEPKIYTRRIFITAETNDYTEYGALQELYGLRRTLSVYGFPYPDAYISNLSELQKKPGLSRWAWEVEFTCHQFESVDKAIIDGMTLPTVISVSEVKKTPFIDDSFAHAGISEPIGYSASRIVEFIDFHGEFGSQLESRIGKSITTTINGEYTEKCKIVNVTAFSPKGGGLIKIFVVELQWYYFNATDSVTFGTVALSNPFFPNAHDISPEYSVDMSAGVSLANPIPVITHRYAVQCVTESSAEIESLMGLMGSKLTLNINGKEIPYCYISSLSKLQPRGGGYCWKYTIEFSKRAGENPISVSWNGITLPNATESGDESVEILSSRTVLKNGKTAARIGTVAARRFTFTCMSNEKTAWNSLYSQISVKSPLYVDGEAYPSMYISNLSGTRKIGDGAARLYTWTVDFEQDTAAW